MYLIISESEERKASYLVPTRVFETNRDDVDDTRGRWRTVAETVDRPIRQDVAVDQRADPQPAGVQAERVGGHPPSDTARQHHLSSDRGFQVEGERDR